MNSEAGFRTIKLGLLSLFVVGLAVWGLLRPPSSTAGVQVISAIDLTGQIRGAVAQTVQASRQLTTISAETSDEVVLQRRETVNGLMAGCERLGSTVKATDSAWIPVAEAVVLLSKTQEFAAAAIAKTPTRQITSQEAAGTRSLETDPDRTGMTRETVQLIESRAKDLLNESEDLLAAVQQSALRAAFSRGSWLGLEARDYLLACLLLAVVAGEWVTWQAQSRSATSPADAVMAELRLQAPADPRAAVERCYTQSGALLKLADEFLTKADFRKVDTDVSAAASAQ